MCVHACVHVRVCMCACVRACMRVYMYVCVCAHAGMRVHMSVCVCAATYKCVVSVCTNGSGNVSALELAGSMPLWAWHSVGGPALNPGHDLLK